MDKDSKYEQFDNLVERNRGLIRRLCWRHSSGSHTLCDELVQDCYVSIWLHLSSLRPDSTTLQKTAWVAWQCRSVFSHRRRRRPSDGVDDLMYDTTTEPERNYMSELIETLAVNLTPKERALLELILEGSPPKELEEKLEMTTEAIKKMRQRIISKMKQTANEINK